MTQLIHLLPFLSLLSAFVWIGLTLKYITIPIESYPILLICRACHSLPQSVRVLLNSSRYNLCLTRPRVVSTPLKQH
jgi:hypothetical protein